MLMAKCRRIEQGGGLIPVEVTAGVGRILRTLTTVPVLSMYFLAIIVTLAAALIVIQTATFQQSQECSVALPSLEQFRSMNFSKRPIHSCAADGRMTSRAS